MRFWSQTGKWKRKSILILSPFSWWRAILATRVLHHPRCKEENNKHNNKVTTYRWEETAMNVLWESDSTSALGFMTSDTRQTIAQNGLKSTRNATLYVVTSHQLLCAVFSSSVLAETLSFLLNEETRTTKVHANNGWNDDVDDDWSSCPPGTTANQHQVR